MPPFVLAVGIVILDGAAGVLAAVALIVAGVTATIFGLALDGQLLYMSVMLMSM